jgi:uncharacterized radical SAM superfamily protein
MVIPVITPTTKGTKIAMSRKGTPEEDKKVEIVKMAWDDSKTFLNPITVTTVRSSSMERLPFNAFNIVLGSILLKRNIPKIVSPNA